MVSTYQKDFDTLALAQKNLGLADKGYRFYVLWPDAPALLTSASAGVHGMVARGVIWPAMNPELVSYVEGITGKDFFSNSANAYDAVVTLSQAADRLIKSGVWSVFSLSHFPIHIHTKQAAACYTGLAVGADRDVLLTRM